MRVVSAALLILSGCSKEPDPLTLILSDSVKSTLEAPDSVKLFRLDLGPYPKGSKKPETWPDAPTTAEVIADAEMSKELSGILRNPKTYDFEGKGCKPTPGVKAQFRRGTTTIEAYLCFECRMVAFFGPGALGERGWASVDNGTVALTRIVKKAFPNDTVIQSLKYWP